MFKFIGTRLLSGVLLVFVISVVAYMMLYVGGGDIARRILGPTASAEAVAEKAHQLGLDRPILSQYLEWLSGALQGQLGRAWFSGELVTDAIVSRLGVTLTLVIGATVLSGLIGVLIGIWAATRGGWIDSTLQVLTIAGFAIPGFLLALGLVVLFAVNLGWFSAVGYVPITESFTGWLRTVTLPIVALSVGATAAIAQQVRGSVLDAGRQDYVRTLRSRGLSQRRVVFKHVLRNAGGPALSVLALQFVGLLGGAVIVEQVFAIPGLGQVAVSATLKGDIPLVMGLVVITAIIVVIVNLLIDLAQGWLNPKARLS